MKLPPYTTAAVFLLVVEEESGKLLGIPAILDTSDDGPLEVEATVERIYAAMAAKGMRRPTMEEYVEHCKDITAAQQGRRLVEAMTERMRGHDLTPEQMDAMLRNHRGDVN